MTPDFGKILKYRYFSLIGLLLTFIYNILKGNNWAEIVFTEVIVALFTCDTLKIAKLCYDEERRLTPVEEVARVGEVNNLPNDEAKKFYGKIKPFNINDSNRATLRLIKEELIKLKI